MRRFTSPLRLAFERWYVQTPLGEGATLNRYSNGEYLDKQTNAAWSGWCASASADEQHEAKSERQAEINRTGWAEALDSWATRSRKTMDFLESVRKAEREWLKDMVQSDLRYKWLSEYLVSPSTEHDDAIVGAVTVEQLNVVIDDLRNGRSE